MDRRRYLTWERILCARYQPTGVSGRRWILGAVAQIPKIATTGCAESQSERFPRRHDRGWIRQTRLRERIEEAQEEAQEQQKEAAEVTIENSISSLVTRPVEKRCWMVVAMLTVLVWPPTEGLY